MCDVFWLFYLYLHLFLSAHVYQSNLLLFICVFGDTPHGMVGWISHSRKLLVKVVKAPLLIGEGFLHGYIYVYIHTHISVSSLPMSSHMYWLLDKFYVTPERHGHVPLPETDDLRVILR